MMPSDTLTSRQRVLRAVNHGKVDRVPIDFGAHFSTGISAFAYWNLREALGLSTDNIEMVDCVQLLARVETDVLERFHVDTILLNPTWKSMHRWNPRDGYMFNVPKTFQPVLQDNGSWKISADDKVAYMPAGGYFFDGTFPNYYNMTVEEHIEYFAESAERIYKETDKFTIYMGFNAFFDGIDFACDMLTDPEDCRRVNTERLERQISYFDKVNKRMGSFINAIEVNSDLGMQDSLMCTPSSYEELCYPFLKQFCEHVHNTSDIKIFMHSCGSIVDALPFIVDAGVDIINPVQISAKNMDPLHLKRQFGDKICFWGGGCDTQNILWRATPQEVSLHVKEMVDIFKPGGGFVFNQVHNIMGNIQPENIIAMFDTAYENSFYSN